MSGGADGFPSSPVSRSSTMVVEIRRPSALWVTRVTTTADLETVVSGKQAELNWGAGIGPVCSRKGKGPFVGNGSLGAT